MNLKLKRLVRTSSSEQYALFDLDQLDDYQQPETIGKLDMHYTLEGVYGTVLFWGELSHQLSQSQRDKLVRALLEEIAQPMGVPNEYVVEFFAPTLDAYQVFHNVASEDALSSDSSLDTDRMDDSDRGGNRGGDNSPTAGAGEPSDVA